MALSVSCGTPDAIDASDREAAAKGNQMVSGSSIAVFGGGCFWCLEAAFELLPGVLDVESGYAGGSRDKPEYAQVSTGLTGHAEVVRITYDPKVISYGSLLDLFFRIHDPTTQDRQGADVGSQYRSVILYADRQQQDEAEKYITAKNPEYDSAIVTEILPLKAFWKAEEYHQDYYRNNPQYSYCKIVVKPKVEKARDFLEELQPASGK